VYPSRRPRPPWAPARELWLRLAAEGVDLRHVISAAAAYAAECEAEGSAGGRYVAYPSTWLRQRRWESYPPPGADAGAAHDPHAAHPLRAAYRELDAATFSAWLAPLRLERRGDDVIVWCPSALVRDQARHAIDPRPLEGVAGTSRLIWLVAPRAGPPGHDR
jgi:hypothetical protein